MPEFTVSLAASADDGYVYKDGSTAYPADSPTGTPIMNDTIIVAAHEWSSVNLFRVFNGLLRFDTGSQLPDGPVIINSASLILDMDSRQSDDGRNVTADYYTWAATTADYTDSAPNNALSGTAITGLSATGVNTIPLTGFSGISKTGYTYLRVHTTGPQPTGRNFIIFGAIEHATLQEPRLYVNYSEPTTTRLAPDLILAQTNLTGAVSAIQDDPDSADANWLTAP